MSTIATIAGLTVRLIADTNKWVRDVNKAAAESARLERAIKNATEPLGTMEKWGKRASLAVAGLTAAMTLGIRNASKYATEIKNVSEQTGLAIETTQALRFAAGEANVEWATLQTGLRAFVRRSSEAARGNQSFLKSFQRLGITQEQVREGLSDTEGLFLLVTERISQMETVADMSAIAMDLMSDSGRKLVPMLAAGRTGIEAWMRDARELGLVLDERLILGFDALGGAVDRTGQRFTRAGQQFLSHFLAPAFVVNSWLNNAITRWNEMDETQRKNIARWVAITAAVLGAIGILGVLAGALRAAIVAFELTGLAAAVSFAGPFLLQATLVGGAVFLLLRHFDDLREWWANTDFGRLASGMIEDIRATWEREDLTFPEKVVQSVRIVARTVTGLIESIIDWWVRTPIRLLRKTVELLGLDPEESALAAFIFALDDIWQSEQLTLSEKIVESLRLVPGGAPIADFIGKLRAVWNDEELTLADKIVETVNLTVGTVSGLVESIITWFAKQTIDLAKTVAVALLPEDHALVTFLTELETIWDNSDLSFAEKIVESLSLVPGGTPVADFISSLRDIWAQSDVTFGEKLVESLNLIPGSTAIADFAARLQKSWLGQGVTLAVDAAIELGGAMYDAIKKGFETGDWSDAFVVGADIWRTGALIAVSLILAADATAAILSAIQTGLGLSTAGAALGVPGVIGALSIAVALAEAQATGDYTKFGQDLVAALAAGIGIGIFTGSPYAGALAFTIVLNLEIGSKVGAALEELRQKVDEAMGGLRPETDALTGMSVERIAIPVPQAPALGLSDTDVQSMIDEALGVAESVTDHAMEIDDATIDLLARLAQAEAGVDGFEGMLAVAAVVLNRVASDEFPDSIRDVIYQVNQFESVLNGTVDEMVATASALRAAREALAGTDPTGGATYFRNPDLATSGWFEAAVASGLLVPVTRIGGHEFYTEGFATGGYTGNAPVDQVVGVVHGQEIVVPARAVRRGLAGILEFLGVPGFQNGLLSAPVFGAAALGGGPSAMLVVPEPTLIERFADALRSAVTAAEEHGSISAERAEQFLGYIAIAESGLERAGEEFDRLIRAFEDPQSVLDGVIEAAERHRQALEEIAEAEQRAAEQERARASITSMLLGQMPLFNNALQTGQTFMMAFGSATAFALGFLLSLALASEPLANAFRVLMVPLGIVAQILGVVLTPILKALFPVIKLFGLVILHAARLGSQIWNAFAKAVNAVLGWLGVNLKLINIGEIDEAISTLAKLTWEEAEAKAGLTGEINAMHDAVRNVPPIFKAALVRGQVASATIPAASVAGVSSVSGGGGAATVEVTVDMRGAQVIGVEDLDRRVKRSVGEALRQANLARYGV